jgi:hypothetical protein
MKKTMGANVAVLGSAAVLSTLAVLAGPGTATASTESTPIAGAKALTPDRSQASDVEPDGRGFAYLQEGDTVAVYRQSGGKEVARVTLKPVTFDSSGGQVVVRVVATKTFSFPVEQFIWEDEQGADTAPLDGERVVRVRAGTTQDVRIDYRNVGPGAVIWANSHVSVAGAWIVSESGAAVTPAGKPRLAYIQRGDTVTAYRGSRVAALVRLRSVTHDDGRGRLVLRVVAKKSFSFPVKQFIWEDEEGADTLPTDARRVVRVQAGTIQNVRIDFRNVGSGAIVWADADLETGGVFAVWPVAGR